MFAAKSFYLIYSLPLHQPLRYSIPITDVFPSQQTEDQAICFSFFGYVSVKDGVHALFHANWRNTTGRFISTLNLHSLDTALSNLH